MFKFMVFFLYCNSALERELGETPARERAIQRELLKFEADRVAAVSSKEIEDQDTSKKVSIGKFCYKLINLAVLYDVYPVTSNPPTQSLD